MRGRKPKDPEVRQRRNKIATAAVLESEPEERKPPPLSRLLFAGGQVHRQTRRWWLEIWRSPMAPRWLPSDVEALYIIAILRNEFYFRPSPSLAAEIRQQEGRFGLTPFDRKRLDWRIEGPRQEMPRQPEIEPERPPEREDIDPRSVLRAVK